jgi:hypothetical protein
MINNFMKHNFHSYYAPNGKGGYKQVSRKQCFYYDNNSFIGPYPQRWYWDLESDFAVRLERNENGEKIFREARSERRRHQKALLEDSGCVFKECLYCKGWDKAEKDEIQCAGCAKHITFIPLDEELVSKKDPLVYKS